VSSRSLKTLLAVVSRAVATFEATEAAASVVFRTVASVKTILLQPFSHYVNSPALPSITPSLFHSWLKIYLFHKPSDPRTDATDFITDRLFLASLFFVLVSSLLFLRLVSFRVED